jgi:hypothetical protein
MWGCVGFSFPGNAVSCWKYGAPGEIRTPDPLVRSQMLYPAELRARVVEAIEKYGWRQVRRRLGARLVLAGAVG